MGIKSMGVLIVSAALGLGAGAAAAQTYPTRPIQLIVSFGAGGASDILARTIGAQIGESLGQPVVVINRPGAGGTIGTSSVASAAPDGYTLALGTPGTHSAARALFPTITYDPIKSFTPVASIAVTPSVLVVRPESPYKSVHDLLNAARQSPNPLKYGSPSSGTTQHMASELLASLAQLKLTHIPYKGTPQAQSDLLSGELDFMFDNILPAMPLIKGGRMRVLAVSTDKRSTLLPDTPTMAEAGVPGFEISSWFGILAPAGTPPEIVTRLNTEVNKALRNENIRSKLFALGAEPAEMSQAEFADDVKRQLEKWESLIRTSGATK
ncbi:MAG: tripartite tricarboxylate transporter substrate binding protein [Burkholderiales bacterium]|nr:tripartite tricarboxylate transporter substrate binding protein [Burkholderiales bacterium]